MIVDNIPLRIIRLNDLCSNLIKANYPLELIMDAMNKYKLVDSIILRTESIKSSNSKMPYIITYTSP